MAVGDSRGAAAVSSDYPHLPAHQPVHHQRRYVSAPRHTAHFLVHFLPHSRLDWVIKRQLRLKRAL